MPPHHRTNDISSGVLHLIGAGLSIAVMVVLIVIGVRSGTPWHVVGYSLYGTGLILLYAASASYHLIPQRFTRAKETFQRLDHAMIFVLIAGTYTPITFLALTGGWRWSLFGVIWGLAFLGATMKMTRAPLHPVVSGLLYLCMGWLILIAFAPLREEITPVTFWLLVSGGLSYTIGLLFFALDRILSPRKYFWMHEIFHVFVLGGSTLHTIAMFFLR